MHRPPPSVEWCAEVVTNVNVFSGAFERQLDDKGRLALPSKLRIDLGERVYLTKGFDRSVTVVPEETFRAEASRLAARVETGDADRDDMRALMWSAVVVTLDKQGRVTLDETLRHYAGIGPLSAVVVAGSYDRLEIWHPDVYAERAAAGTARRAGASAR